MNYKEYLEFRKNIDLTRFKDFGNLNLYEAIPGPILKDISLGHCNGNVHRCHLAEDFCRVMNIEYKTRENMAISYGVRDCLNIMMSVYKHHKWILPSDTYPFYQKTANLHNVEYCQYETLGKKDIIYPEGDILLICFPSKPSGRILSLKEIEDIYKWKKQSSHRMVIVDCAYCIKITEHIKMMQSYDFTLLFSLSKIWSHHNIMGLAILSNNNLEIRNIFIQRKMDKIKMHQAYNLINKDTYFIQDMIRILNTKLEKLTDFKIKTQNNIPGYLFYSHRNFQDYLNQGILTMNSGYPSGWAGGVHAFDLYADGGSVGAGYGSQLNAYINRDGQGYLSDTLQVNGKVTAGNDVEMTAGDLTMDNGNFHMKNGNTVMDKGYFMMQNGDEWINKGNLIVNNGGVPGSGQGWFQDGLTVGRNPQGKLGNQYGDNNIGGGNLIIRGNEILSGSIKFNYGLTDGSGSSDGSGGFAGGGSDCTELSTGPGSIDFDLEKNGFYICTSDNRWHRVLTDQDK